MHRARGNIHLVDNTIIMCMLFILNLNIFVDFRRSWDKVYVVLHGNTLSCYKDEKIAKQVSVDIY